MVNYEYFEGELDSDKSYILGYLWADGNLTKYQVTLGCVTEDEEVILQIREELESRHKVARKPGYFDPKGTFHKSKTVIQICSKSLAETLIYKYGIFPNKSNLDLTFPRIPSQYLADFCRGYASGDGSVGNRKKRQFYFVGSPRFIEEMQNVVISTLGVGRNKLGRDGKVVRVCWYDRSDLQSLYYWMFGGTSKLYSPRKKREFEEMLCL